MRNIRYQDMPACYIRAAAFVWIVFWFIAEILCYQLLVYALQAIIQRTLYSSGCCNCQIRTYFNTKTSRGLPLMQQDGRLSRLLIR